jgi:D-methionine transport system substrate-binding protein
MIPELMMRHSASRPVSATPIAVPDTRTRRSLCRPVVLLAMTGAMVLAGLAPARAEEAFRVGVMSGDGELLMEQVALQAKAQGLPLRVVAFSDYLLPNEALNHGELDANAFQHMPYLENQVKSRGYRIVSAGWTVVSPIGLYSRKVKSPAGLADSARVGIPNDPSNGGRGLNLLAALGMITLRPGAGITPTTLDITANPKKLRIVELDAGIIARSLDDLDAAVVNTDWALKSGLGLDLRIAAEAVDDNPYRNVIAVRAGQENDPRVKRFVAAYQSDAVKAWIIQHYQGRQLPAW